MICISPFARSRIFSAWVVPSCRLEFHTVFVAICSNSSEPLCCFWMWNEWSLILCWKIEMRRRGVISFASFNIYEFTPYHGDLVEGHSSVPLTWAWTLISKFFFSCKEISTVDFLIWSSLFLFCAAHDTSDRYHTIHNDPHVSWVSVNGGENRFNVESLASLRHSAAMHTY